MLLAMCALAGPALSTAAHAADTDLDGIEDDMDNCTEFFNPRQLDGDGDMYGNECDGDLDNDGSITTLDFGILLARIGTQDAAVDYIRDGVVSSADVDYWVSVLHGAPLGPSGRSLSYTSGGLSLGDSDADGWREFGSDPAMADLCPGFYNADANGDVDGDGIGDGCDLCLNLDDSSTRGVDTDGDGIGNACDADYNNDGAVTTMDFGVFMACFQAGPYAEGSPCAEVDSTADGAVTTLDFGSFLAQFIAGIPGESGLVCADPTAQSPSCPAYGRHYDALDGWLGEISGYKPDLQITNTETLTNLDGLANLTSVRSLVISDNAALTNLDGLANSTWDPNNMYILTISNNPVLANVDGLVGVTYVDGDVTVSDNAALTHVDGLVGLSGLRGNLMISDNDALTNVDGLLGLGWTWRYATISNNNALTDVNGLGGLGFVRGLTISDNDTLTSLAGLGYLYEVSEYLLISNNHALTNMSGFEGLETVTSLIISDNDALTSLDGFERLEDAQELIISNNDVLTSLGGFGGLWRMVSWSAFIQDNASLCQDDAFGFVNARRGLLAGTVSISNNLGTCP
jgi:hypothetical protein